MSTLLASLARTLSRRWKRGLVGLLAAIVLIGVAVGSQTGSAAEDFAIPGTESQRAQDLLEDKFPAASGVTAQAVFTVKSGKLTDAEPRQAIEAALERVGRLDHVTSVSEPLAAEGGSLSEDGRTAFATVQYDIQPTELEKEDGEALGRDSDVISVPLDVWRHTIDDTLTGYLLGRTGTKEEQMA